MFCYTASCSALGRRTRITFPSATLNPYFRFTPDVLGLTSTSALFMLCSEVALMKLGFYLLNIQVQVHLLDLFAYAGYKFVGFVLFFSGIAV